MVKHFTIELGARSSPDRPAQNSTKLCADSLVEPITNTRHYHIDFSLATSHTLGSTEGLAVVKRAALTKRDSVFVGPLRHVWYPDTFRTQVTSTEQTFSIASAVTSDNASRPYGNIDVLQPILWSSTWRAPWMPTCVITFCLVGVVAEAVTAQSERRSSLRCLVTARGGS
jgi:hypothetical protein